MTQDQITRVMVIGGEETDTIRSAISAGGYERITANAYGADSLSGAPSAPDIVLVNLFGANDSEDPARFISTARAFKSDSANSETPVILIGPSAIVTDNIAAQCDPLFDDVLLDPVNDIQITRRIDTLARLNTMQAELHRRQRTLEKFGVDAPLPPTQNEDVDDATILVLGASLEFGQIENALSSSATLVGALSKASALDYLGRQTFDLLMINLSDDLGEIESFCRALRRNPRLYNLPILILADTEQRAHADLAVIAGATSHMAKPLDNDELQNRVMSHVREVRFRDAMREVYGRARHMATSDALTGLYSRGFLLDHLQTVIDDAKQTGHVFTLAFFELKNIPTINDQHGYITGDRIIRQVGEMMGMLVRGEDLMARYSGTKFVALLPGTGIEAAQIALARLAGVVNFTEFSFMQDAPTAQINDIIRVQLACGTAAFQKDDTPEALIERAKSMCAGNKSV